MPFLQKRLLPLLFISAFLVLAGCGEETPEGKNQKTVTEQRGGEVIPAMKQVDVTTQDIHSVMRETFAMLADGETPADSLIRTTYPESELLSHLKYSELMETRPPECVRVSGSYGYFVYRSHEGGYLFLLFSFANGDSLPVDRWYVKEALYASDFDLLAVGESNVDDVMLLDPYGDYSSFYEPGKAGTKFWSTHRTLDGYFVRVSYSWDEDGTFIVQSVRKLQGSQNRIYSLLKDVDKALISGFFA